MEVGAEGVDGGEYAESLAESLLLARSDVCLLRDDSDALVIGPLALVMLELEMRDGELGVLVLEPRRRTTWKAEVPLLPGSPTVGRSPVV